MKLESSAVYGPVNSRRFGWDLGVNLLPTNRKSCTYNCVYCQYGSTPRFTNATFDSIDVDQILTEWERKISICLKEGITIRHTTIAGNGEPTMHPKFAQIAKELIQWRNLNAPEMRLAILSNGYRLHNPAIRKAFLSFDEPIIKLDSGVPKTFVKMNRPMRSFSFSQFLRDLKQCSGFIIQTMFMKGWNDWLEELVEWRKALLAVKPDQVQIYTITRDTALPNLAPVPTRDLIKIAQDTTALTNIPTRAFV